MTSGCFSLQWMGGCVLVCASVAAQASAIWDARQPDQLRLPSVRLGDQRLVDVSLRVGAVRSWALNSSGQRENHYDATTGLLNVAEVVVHDVTYYNVTIEPAQVLGIGGWSNTTTRRVKVVGDSLADGGTFGYKFTVQGTASAPAQIWTDRVAAALSAPALCPRYKGLSDEEAILNPDPASAGCTSFAVGGGRIHPLGILNRSFGSTPFSLTQQMRDLALADPYADNDLLLLVGGGNDAADVLGAFIKADSDQGLAFSLLISELLSSAQVFKAMTHGRDGRMEAGHLHMQALADRLVDHMKADALDKGAKRIVVLTLPDVSRTPRFAAMLASRSDAASLSALASGWVSSYNQQLQTRLAAYADRVMVVDFFSGLNRWLDQPAAHGLTHTSTPACPVVSTDSYGLPKYDLATCVGTHLPSGWEQHVFSDHFHGTPRVNQLLADDVLKALYQKGWR